MQASLSLDIDSPEIAKKSIEVDSKNSGSIKTNLEAGDRLKARVEADRLSNLRAGINTLIRLVKVSQSATRS